MLTNGVEIMDTQSKKEGEFCKIFRSSVFGYTKVYVEQPIYENGRVKKDKNGNPKPDPKRRDSEHIQLDENIDNYFIKKVKPNLPDSWMDRSKDKIGYEINFNRIFYKNISIRSLDEINKDLKSINEEVDVASKKIFNE